MTRLKAIAALTSSVVAGSSSLDSEALAQPTDLELFDAPESETRIGDSQQAEASAAFQQGEAAYRDHRYAEAAKRFDEAQSLAPHHAALWNSARAWQKAGRADHAATRFEQFLQAAPPGATGVDEATSSLDALRPTLGAIEVRPNGGTQLRVGDTLYAPPKIYVMPGKYDVSATFATGVGRSAVDVKAGQSLTVSMTAPAAPPEAKTSQMPNAPSQAALTSPAVESKSSDDGISPWFVVGGAGLTVAFGVTAIWSTVDAQQRRNDFEADPTGENRKLVDRAQVRTGSLVVGAGVAGAVTLGMALFFVDWGGQPDQTTTWLSPNGVGLRHRFP